MDALIILGCLLIVLNCPCIRSRLAVCLPCCNGRPGAVVVSYGLWCLYNNNSVGNNELSSSSSSPKWIECCHTYWLYIRSKIRKKVIVLTFLRVFNLIAVDIRIIRFADCWYSILTLTLTQAIRDFGLYFGIIEDCTKALKDSFQAEWNLEAIYIASRWNPVMLL